MASTEFDLPDDDGNDTPDNSNNSSGKGLRAQLEAALAAKKELEDKLNELSKKDRVRSLGDIFGDLKIDAKKVALYNQEDTSAEAVRKWAEEFGFINPDETPADPASAKDPQMSAIAAISQASSSASSAAPVTNLAERMKGKSYEELVKEGLIRTGYPVVTPPQ